MSWFLALLVISLWWSVDALCNPPTPTLPTQLTDTHSYITPNYGTPDGHQVIYTGAQFNCHGYITSWSTIAAIDVRFRTLTQAIHMQVWRPGKNRTYHFVGGDYLQFIASDITSGLLDVRPADTNYWYSKFTQKTSSLIHFQPGDVIGYYVPPFHWSTGARGALSPLYRTGVPGNHGNMLVSVTPHSDGCEVLDCGGSVQRRIGVTPLVSVEYVAMESLGNTPSSSLSNCSTSAPSCCPFTSHQEIEALDDCYSSSFRGQFCHSHLSSTLHLQPNSNTTLGQQVLFPDISFSCHGYIANWSALTLLDARLAQPDAFISHTIHLQVWRPTGSDRYRLVGSEQFFFSRELTNGYRIPGSFNSYFVFSSRSGTVTSGAKNGRLHFEPGDVIGYFSPARFRTFHPPLSVVYSLGGEGSRMLVGRSNGVTCEDVSGVEMSSKVIPWISLKTVPLDVGPRLSNTTHSSLCNKSFSVTKPSWQSSMTDLQRSSPSQPARQTPGPNIDCAGDSCNHPSPLYGILPILASTLVLIVGSFSLLLCSILFCYARKRHTPHNPHTPHTHHRSHSISQPILTNNSNNSRDETSSEEDAGRSASACALRENSRPRLNERCRTVSTEYGLDDASTRTSNLLEFHAYPHYTHHSSTLRVSEVTV